MKQPIFTMPSTNDHKTRLKRLYYRSWHRGCKETDLLFGRFADATLHQLTEDELEQYEALLAEFDADIWNWYTGKHPLPEELNTPVWHKLKTVNEAAVAKYPL